MRFRYLLSICLVLIVAAASCKKEPEPVSEGAAVEKAVAKKAAVEKAAVEEAVLEEAAVEEPEHFAVFMEGKKVGYAILSRVVADGKVTTSEKINITISRGNIPVTMDMTETSIETTDGEPLGFEAVQELGAMTMKVTGVVDEQGKVNLTVAEKKSTLEWPSGAVMAEGLRLLTLKKGVKEGLEYTAKVFSPSIMQALDGQVHIGSKRSVDLLGRVVVLREMVTTVNMPGAGEIISTSYVDEDLKVQKSIMPMAGIQVEMIACTKEFALGKNDVFEVIDMMFLASPAPLGNLSSVKSITYHLSPTKETANLTIPSNDNQSVRHLENGNIILTVKPVAAPAGARFPYKGKDKTLLEAMKPTRYLQSDHKEIIALARRAVGGTKDAAEAAKKIEAFVAKYIENKSLSVGYATAVEVAASRQGDCSEHAVLAAAMCRAVGIPAQMVVGVAYVDDFAGRQGFGGHAWVQAYIGGKWVGLDAAFKGTGRGGYDAGHITLAAGSGEPADFFNIVTTLGNFKIDKVIVNKD
ncbi:MAG: transglutaminase-like domain-containing protein [Planctomycetota bacterium]|jgi:hypothetical protein